MTRIKSTLFIFILLVLTIPTAYKGLNILTEYFNLPFKIPTSKGLEGYFEPSVRPAFSMTTFRTGEYQTKLAPHLERTVGFHDDFTRIYNQCDFTMFAIPHAARIILGKHDIMQIDSHIDAALGKDFVGKRLIDDKVSRLKYLQDYLWDNKGVHLLVIFAPGKGYYFPESIPDRLKKGDTGITNNEYYTKRMLEAGINLIDFNKWLIMLKDTSRHNLYPYTGAHWSCYGAYLCADSLISYLEVKLNRQLPCLVLDSLVLEKEARKEDDDMDRTLNLLWKNPVPVMTYPVFHHAYPDSVPKPAVLFISDSFYWYWHYNGIIKNSFAREDLWYYDKEVYPDQNTNPTNTAQIDLDSAISKQKVVILMGTNAAYGYIGYGFVDRAYEYYFPGKTRIKQIEDVYRSNPGLIELTKEKAKAQNIPVEAMIRTDAIYLYNNELRRLSKNKNP